MKPIASRALEVFPWLGRIPPINFREFDGHKTISPALHWERINNQETPQLYPLFPWGIYGIGKPDLDIAINTWKYDSDAVKFRSHTGWKQDNIFAARLGLVKEAAELAVRKMKNADRRFPAFWGPGFDWTTGCRNYVTSISIGENGIEFLGGNTFPTDFRRLSTH